jgi:flagellar hook-associated protein 3 FlgL
MDLRVTPQTLISSTLANFDRQTSLLAHLQEQASTGKKIIVPSDDPLNVSPLLTAKTQDSRLSQDLANIQTARSSLEVSTSALQEAHDVFTQARTLALDATQSTNDATSRASIAQQIDRLIDRLTSLANTQYNDRYLFAGAATGTQPFVVTKDSQGSPQSVSYQGADRGGAVPIGAQQSVDTLYSGQDVFQGESHGSSEVHDAFQSLIALRDQLLNVPNVPEDQLVTDISASVTELDHVNDNVMNALGEQSASLQSLDDVESHVKTVQLNTQTQIGNLESVDLSQIIIQLQAQQNQLQLTMASSVRLFDQSLLDFLR